MSSNDLDRLIMLLSADWFLRSWSAVGIHLDDPTKTSLRDGFREIVKQIMSGAKEYSLATFSPERIRNTRAMVDTLLKHSEVENSAIKAIESLIAARQPGSTPDEETGWLLPTITEMIAGDSSNEHGLPPRVKSVVGSLWERQGADTIDLEESCLASRSSWDHYLRGLTPDLPTSLADYADSIISANKFGAFWGDVKLTLTPAEMQELLRIYSSLAQSLTGEKVTLPMNISK
jgi:hypothetical protein